MGGPRGPAPPAPPWREFPYGSQGMSGERGHAHAEPADRMLEVLDQLGWIESALGIGRRRGRRGYLLGLRRSSMAKIHSAATAPTALIAGPVKREYLYAVVHRLRHGRLEIRSGIHRDSTDYPY